LKKIVSLLASIGLAALLASCSAPVEELPIQPAADKLTFVFFYTDS